MSKENHLSYLEVANIANLLTSEGKRVTLEYVRRALGRGTHSQIAVFLSKWQQAQRRHKNNRANNLPTKSAASATPKAGYGPSKSNTNSNNRPESIRKERHASRQVKDTHGNKGRLSAYDKSSFLTPAIRTFKKPFSSERLNQEKTVVKNLFWAVYQVKSLRLNTLEFQQKTQNHQLILRMERESEIRQIKKENQTKIVALLAEFNHIKAASDRKIGALRQQLGL